MSKRSIAFLITLIVGIFFIGIGSGVTFAEFSKMEYGKSIVIGEEDCITEDFSIKLELKNNEKAFLDPTYYRSISGEFVTPNSFKVDGNLPKNTVVYTLKYNPNQVQPVIQVNDPKVSGYDNLEGQFVNLTFYSQIDDLKMFFEMKDRILADLKEGKLNSYIMGSVFAVEIKVSPDLKDKVELLK